MRIEYIIFNQKYEMQVVELWNRCCLSDPITVNKFEVQALFDDNFDEKLTQLALEGDRVIGFVMATKRKFPYYERGTEPERGWINVLFVDEDYRNRGIGTHLYCLMEERLVSLGVKEITLAAYSPGYFFSGIDKENYSLAASFFMHLGYQNLGLHYSMGKNLQGFTISEKIQNQYHEVSKKGFKFVDFSYDRSIELIEFLTSEFGGGWKRNALIALRNRTAENLIMIVLDCNDEICGFCMRAIDGNEMRFGPIGIAKKYRSTGIGSVLLNVYCLCLARKGIDHIFFMSTDEAGRRYYSRNGFELMRTYSDFRKKFDS